MLRTLLIALLVGLVIGPVFPAPESAVAQDGTTGDDDTKPTDDDEPPESLITNTVAEEDRRVINLSLEEAIRIALAHNIDLQLEQITYDNNVRDIVIARAAFDPVFATNYTMSKFRSPTVDFLSGVTGGATTVVAVNPFTSQVFDVGLSGLIKTGATYNVRVEESRGDSPDSGFFGINPRNSTSIRADVTQPLLKNAWGVNTIDTDIAKNNEAFAREGLQRLLQTTISAVDTAYWNLVFVVEDLKVKEKALEEAEALLEINENKVAVGTAKRIDIIDAKANIETQKSAIIQAKNTLRKAQDDLLDLLQYREVLREQGDLPDNAPLYEHISVLPSDGLQFERYPVDMAEAIRLALTNREDLKQARIDVQNAELEVRRRKNQLRPSLDLVGSWTQRGLEENIGNSFDELFSGRFYDWSLGVSFSYPLGNRREKNLLAQAEANLETARLSLRKKENEVILEVTQFIRDIDSTYQQVITNQASATFRREQFEAEQQRLRVGSSTAYLVQQVQNDLLEAESELVRAQVAYRLAISAYESAVSIIWRRVAEGSGAGPEGAD